jgi:DNA polymerase/3'-5' exonuclease PolX
MTKQSTLFSQNEPSLLLELDLQPATALANEILSAVMAQCERIEVAGSIRRQRPKVHDVDFVVVAKSDADWQRINETLKRLKAKSNCSGKQLIKTYVPFQNGLFQVDFYRAKHSTFGIHLLIRTGSALHNCWLAGHAISKGMRLKYSEGLIKDGVPIAGEDESGVFTALGLPCPSPAEREIVDGKPAWLPNQGDAGGNG